MPTVASDWRRAHITKQQLALLSVALVQVREDCSSLVKRRYGVEERRSFKGCERNFQVLVLDSDIENDPIEFWGLWRWCYSMRAVWVEAPFAWW